MSERVRGMPWAGEPPAGSAVIDGLLEEIDRLKSVARHYAGDTYSRDRGSKAVEALRPYKGPPDL